MDLDLDVVRRFDGSAEILDEDEFAEHRVRYGYPPEVTDHAERAASAMLAAVTSGTEPFGQVCRGWRSESAPAERVVAASLLVAAFFNASARIMLIAGCNGSGCNIAWVGTTRSSPLARF